MPEPLDDAELERHMDETLARVESLRAGETPPERVPDAPEARGETEDGRVRVVVRAGAVQLVSLDPRLLRLPPDRLAELVREAANAAIAELLGRPTADVPDLAELARTLHQVRDEALYQMDVISRSIASAMARIRERTSVAGDPRPRGLEDLLDLTRRNLDDALAGVDGLAEPVRGKGEAARGWVRVVVTDGRVESVRIHPKAMAEGSYELGDHLRAAMNAAFEDLPRRRQGTGAVDLADVARRARETQLAGVAQMHAATRALRDIMTSIQGPE
ncbi:hypothetical protein ACBJ59_15100 [Nonomuraea sp. MTCD27]|uniref:hypothetical protein n=1 Tax=Nonomuraea sp. MTCD27 TaxID=1676747 RepID=UPI0035C19CB8